MLQTYIGLTALTYSSCSLWSYVSSFNLSSGTQADIYSAGYIGCSSSKGFKGVQKRGKEQRNERIDWKKIWWPDVSQYCWHAALLSHGQPTWANRWGSDTANSSNLQRSLAPLAWSPELGADTESPWAGRAAQRPLECWPLVKLLLAKRSVRWGDQLDPLWVKTFAQTACRSRVLKPL